MHTSLHPQSCVQDKQKWQVGWDEMSGSARALLRALQLWLVPGEYQSLAVTVTAGEGNQSPWLMSFKWDYCT